MIAVVDYCKGNLKSVERGLRSVGADARITDDPAVIAAADAIVLPGVGSFADASETMRELGQMEVIKAAIENGVPFLGICLGLHLLFQAGDEGATVLDAADACALSQVGASEVADAGEVSYDSSGQALLRPAGLGIIEGICGKIPSHDEQGNFFKVPHVGWNSLELTTDDPLFNGIGSGEYFYFTHSYCAPQTDATIATTTHSITFPSAVRAGENVWGVQFHPEKSSDAGAHLLANFCKVAGQI